MTSRIALYGGSFNPIHNGHLITARSAAESLTLDRVIFLPSAHPPHKDAARLLNPSHRAEMVKLAIGGEPIFDFSDYDLLQSGPTYTVDTIAHFARTLGPDVTLHWIIGADSLAELTTWRRVAALADNCLIVTVARHGWDATGLDVLRSALTDQQIERIRRHVLETPYIDISATDVRCRVAAGRSIRYLVPDRVRSYIQQHALYRDLDS